MKNIWRANSKQDRFDFMVREKTMKAVVTQDNSGYDQLVCREVCRPVLKAGQVLLQVLATGVTKTEINTRIGWYSSGYIYEV